MSMFSIESCAALAASTILLVTPLAALAQQSGDTYVSREFSLFIGAGGHTTSREATLFIANEGGKAVTREVSFQFHVCITGQQAPSITTHPISQSTCCFAQVGGCVSTATIFSVRSNSTEYTAYEWQVEAAPGIFVPLTNGANTLSFGQLLITGQNTADCSITLNGVSRSTSGISFRCIVANACGNVTSNPATLTVCRGDYNCDSGVDGDDVIAFFAAWDAGDVAADINQDQGVDGDDVISFFIAWDGGC